MVRLARAPWSYPMWLLPLCLAGCAGAENPADDGGTGPGPGPGDGGVVARCDPSPPPAATCPVTLRFKPAGTASAVSVAGEWNAWSTTAQPMASDGQGAYQVTLKLAPGLYAYKFVADGNWYEDPQNPYRKYNGGIENSGLRVADCNAPSLQLAAGSARVTRPAAGQGSFGAVLSFVPGAGGEGLCKLDATLRASTDAAGAAPRALSSSEILLSADHQSLTVSLANLPDGKYTVSLRPTAGSHQGDAVLLPFWIEASDFQWVDTPIYMAVTDRFLDGDPTNDPRPTAGVFPAADYKGGDLAGLTQKIHDGYFDQRQIRALWITPWVTQPTGGYPDQTNKNISVSSYHGYWPVKAREVDPRLGGAAALQAMVQEAHRHGIRVLMDAVLHHVHEQHEYLQDPSRQAWFHQGCVCGVDPNCDWTAHRLDCVFAPYMPNIDWTNTAASEQFLADTLWWIETFDLDGLRVDAVKHVPDLAIFNLGTRVRERFETAGTRYYLLGETAMGWTDGSIADNAENYDTIKRYLGPEALDGQFDFVWYYAVPMQAFCRDFRRFLHVDYWTYASLAQFAGFDMVKYIGSHDSPRFVSLSTYRDQSPQWPSGVTGNKWDNLAVAPPDQEPYDRLWLAELSLMTTPGIPLLYYGDEHGEFGSSDPDNRHMMRFSGLSSAEAAQDARMTALLTARSQLRGLGRGDMKTAYLTEDVYAYARPDAEAKGGALVVLNRLATQQMVAVPVPPELGWTSGAALRDYLGGTEYSLGGSTLMVTVPARGGLIIGMK